MKRYIVLMCVAVLLFAGSAWAQTSIKISSEVGQYKGLITDAKGYPLDRPFEPNVTGTRHSFIFPISGDQPPSLDALKPVVSVKLKLKDGWKQLPDKPLTPQIAPDKREGQASFDIPAEYADHSEFRVRVWGINPTGTGHPDAKWYWIPPGDPYFRLDNENKRGLEYCGANGKVGPVHSSVEAWINKHK